MIMLCCIFLTNTVYCMHLTKKTKLTKVLSQRKYNQPKYNIKLMEDALVTYGDDDPWSEKIYYEIGMEYYYIQKYKEAINAFDKSLQLPETLEGSHSAALNMEMNIYRATGDLEEAIKAADKLANYKGTYFNGSLKANAIMVKASLEESLDHRDDSIKSYETVIDQVKDVNNDELPYAYRSLILLYSKKGKIEKAIATCNKFLYLFPRNEATAFVAAQREQLKKGKSLKYRLSYEDLEGIIKKYPADTGLGQLVLSNLANAYLYEGKQSEAIAIFTDIFNYKKKTTDKEYNPYLSIESALSIYKIYKEDNNINGQRKILKDIIKKFPDQSSEAKNLLKALNKDTATHISSKVILPVVIMLFFVAFAIIRRNKRQNNIG